MNFINLDTIEVADFTECLYQLYIGCKQILNCKKNNKSRLAFAWGDEVDDFIKYYCYIGLLINRFK